MLNIMNSPWAKFTISISPKIRLKPAAINAYTNPMSSPLMIAWMMISRVMVRPFIVGLVCHAWIGLS